MSEFNGNGGIVALGDSDNRKRSRVDDDFAKAISCDADMKKSRFSGSGASEVDEGFPMVGSSGPVAPERVVPTSLQMQERDNAIQELLNALAADFSPVGNCGEELCCDKEGCCGTCEGACAGCPLDDEESIEALKDVRRSTPFYSIPPLSIHH